MKDICERYFGPILKQQGLIVRRRLPSSMLARGGQSRSILDLPNSIAELDDSSDLPISGCPKERLHLGWGLLPIASSYFLTSGNPVPRPGSTRRTLPRLTEGRMRVSFTKGAGK